MNGDERDYPGALYRALTLIAWCHRAIITELQLTTQQTAEDVIYLKDILENKIEEDERVAIRKWLHPDGTNAEASLATALEMKQSETGRWLLDSEDFTAWTKNVHGCMWLYGIGELTASFCKLDEPANPKHSGLWEDYSLVGLTL